MPKAFSYIRFSRPEQLKGDSLRRQLEAARVWAEKRGVPLDDSHRDLGKSAFRGKNRTEGALKKLLALVDQGKVQAGDFLLIESLDRLSREAVIHALPRFMDLINAGITIVTLMDRQEYSKERLREDWTPLIMSLAVMARAHEESSAKAERLSAAWQRKKQLAAQGIPMTRRLPGWLRLKDGKFEVIEERARIIKRIFEMARDGIGRRKIVSILNAEGVPSFKKRDGWQDSYVSKLLNGESVLGVMQPYRKTENGRVPDGSPIANHFPQIISEELYYAARKARAKESVAPGRRGAKFGNLLTGGLVRCDACRSSLRFVDKGKPPKGGQYLVCANALRGLCSRRKHHPYHAIENLILDHVYEINEALKDVAQTDRAADQAATKRAEIVALRGKIEKARTRRKNLRESFADEPDEDLKAMIESLSDEIKTATARLTSAEKALKELVHASDDAKQSVQEIGRLRQLLQTVDQSQQYEIRAAINQRLRSIIWAIVVEGNGTLFAYMENESGLYMIHPDGTGGRFSGEFFDAVRKNLTILSPEEIAERHEASERERKDSVELELRLDLDDLQEP